MLRRATEDVVLNTDDPDISSGRLIIHQGTTLAVDMVGMRMLTLLVCAFDKPS